MNDKEKILGKIKKCLAMAANSDSHEAMTALRQARHLMKEHDIGQTDIDLMDVQEVVCRGLDVNTPPRWHGLLVHLVSEAFAVRAFYISRFLANGSDVVFVGVEPASTVAGYAYDVLYRQVKRDRSTHIKAQSKRCKAATKTRRGDLFAEGWLRGAHSQLKQFAEPASAQHQQLVQQYMDKHHPAMEKSKLRSHRTSGNDHESAGAGYQKGKNAELNRGMSETKRARLTHH